MSVQPASVTYVWRIPKAPYWASETKLLSTKTQNGEEHTSIGQSDANGFACGLAPQEKSDIVLVPCCLGNIVATDGPAGAIALCESYLAAGGSPTSACQRPVLMDRLSKPEVDALGLEIGFTLRLQPSSKRAEVGKYDQRVLPGSSALAAALCGSHLSIGSIRASDAQGVVAGSLDVVVAMGKPAEAADTAELLQAIAAGFEHTSSVVELWVSTAESRKEGGAASLLTRLQAASSSGVSANSRTGRFYIPASVARMGSGHYIDQDPADCKTSYEYVMNAIDLWSK